MRELTTCRAFSGWFWEESDTWWCTTFFGYSIYARSKCKKLTTVDITYLNIQGSTQAAINNEIATLVAKAAGKFFSFILSIKLKEWFWILRQFWILRNTVFTWLCVSLVTIIGFWFAGALSESCIELEETIFSSDIDNLKKESLWRSISGQIDF